MFWTWRMVLNTSLQNDMYTSEDGSKPVINVTAQKRMDFNPLSLVNIKGHPTM